VDVGHLLGDEEGEAVAQGFYDDLEVSSHPLLHQLPMFSRYGDIEPFILVEGFAEVSLPVPLDQQPHDRGKNSIGS